MRPHSDSRVRPSAGLEELLAEAPFVQRLAKALVRDEHAAEDLAQDSWVVALEKPPRSGALGAWFATVLRNRAHNAERERARREARESINARPEGLPPSDAAHEKLETQHKLTELVVNLGEPYRTALFLRYYEDLSPTRIAAHLGIPLKTRLARALVALRRRMDARHDGDRGAWLAALAPLTRPVDGATLSTLTGILMKKTVLVPIVLVVAGMVFVRFAPFHDPPTVLPVPLAPAVLLSEITSGEELAETADRLGSRLVAREPGAPPLSATDVATGDLDVTVRWADGTSAAGVGVRATFAGRAVSREQVRVVQSDEQGLARFERLPAGDVLLRPDRSHQRVEVIVVGGERRALDFVLDAGLDVVGRVVDPDGRGVGGAEIWAEGWRSLPSKGRLLAHAAPDGSYRLKAMGAGAHIGARAAGFQPSPVFEPGRMPEASEGVRLLNLTLGAPGGRLSGRVLSPDGEPIAGAQVLAGPRGGFIVNLPNGPQGAAATPVIVETDERGEFVYPGDLPPGDAPVHALAPRLPAWSGFVTIEAGRERFLEITLDHPARIEGRLLTERGEPVPEGTVLVAVEVGGGWYHHQVPPPKTKTDEDGRFVLAGVAPGEREVNATPPRGSREGRARVRVVCVEGETTRIELVLDRGELISGRVVDLNGSPVPNWSVSGEPAASGRVYSRSDRTDEEGRFVLTNVGACQHRLKLKPSGYYGSPLATLDDVAPGTTDLEIVVDTTDGPSAFVHGVLRDINSRPPQDVWFVIRRGNEGSGFFVDFDPVDGRFSHGPIVPGRYTLDVMREGKTVFKSEPFSLRANQKYNAGLVQLGELGTVEIILEGVPADDLARLEPHLDRAGASTLDVLLEDGRFRATGVAPGEWILTSRNSPWFLPDTMIEVRAGKKARVEWTAEPVAMEVQVACLFDEGGRGWSTLRVEIRDEHDEAIWLDPNIRSSRLRDGRIELHRLLLPEGRFTIDARTDTGLGAVEEFVIDGNASARQDIELVMR